jgi:hypothetical protein
MLTCVLSPLISTPLIFRYKWTVSAAFSWVGSKTSSAKIEITTRFLSFILITLRIDVMCRASHIPTFQLSRVYHARIDKSMGEGRLQTSDFRLQEGRELDQIPAGFLETKWKLHSIPAI